MTTENIKKDNAYYGRDDEICPKCKSDLEYIAYEDWEIEIWHCTGCNADFSVHVNYVRDWADMEEMK